MGLILPAHIRLGTRGSPLALAQSQLVVSALAQQGVTVSTSIIKTSGDVITDKPLYEIGGKGLFAKEIEQALLKSDIDIAVHSLKDLESVLPPGLTLAAVLPREAPEDILLSPKHVTLASLPVGARIGTCSPRRRAYLNHYRPDINVIALRGNIQKRLQKLEEENLDGIILAAAGLNRLQIHAFRQHTFATDYIIPAVGQGIIAIECRNDRRDLINLMQSINCSKTWNCMVAERQLLASLEGNCRTPIAGFAQLMNHDMIMLSGMMAEERTHGRLVQYQASHHDPRLLGTLVAQQLKKLLNHD